MERLSIPENEADSVPLDQPASEQKDSSEHISQSKSPFKSFARAFKHTAHFIGFPVQTNKDFGPDATVNANLTGDERGGQR